MVRMARCCNPVPGDPIIGFITKGSGISVHRADCPNMRPGACDVDRLIEVEWDGATTESFQATLELDAYDRNGLLMDVMATLSELKINVINVNSRLDEAEKQVHMSLIIDVKNVPQLEFVMTKLRRVKDVYTIRRTKGGGM
jgi:GTP diphosphokinase